MQRFVQLCAAAICSMAMMGAHAQLNPTVSGDNMLCPNGTGTVSTQQFDSYQWLVRIYGTPDTNPIPGATSQSLTVDYANYAASYVSVIVTAGAQTDTSAEFMIDGWMFPGMTVMSDGEFTIGPNGESMMCPGDTMYFHVNAPYGTNTQWYESGNPIPGATDPTLTVTQPGVYEVLSAPGACPDMISSPGVSLVVDQWVFIGMTVMSGGDFEIGPNGESIICEGESMYFECLDPYTSNVQWYMGGNPIPGANDVTLDITQAGVYTVEAAPYQCPDWLSNPGVDLVVLVENCSGAGINEPVLEAAELFPVPATDLLHVTHPTALIREIVVTNQLGQLVFTTTPNAFATEIPTSQLQQGYYFVTIRYNEGSETRAFTVE